LLDITQVPKIKVENGLPAGIKWKSWRPKGRLAGKTYKNGVFKFSNYLQETRKRYLDDCLIVWIKDLDKFNTFL